MKQWIKSFKHAWNGLLHLFGTEKNAKIELFIAVITIGMGLFFNLKPWEWISVLLCIFGVLALEALNTAFEKALDRLHPEQNEKIGMAKDLSAAAVLLASIASVIIGLIIFYPHLKNWLLSL